MKVECPRCKTRVEAAAGQDVSCPTCGFSAAVPADAVPPSIAEPRETAMPQANAGGSWTSTGGTVVTEAAQAPKTGMAITALVLAIVGFLTNIFLLGVPLSIVAIVLAIVVLVQHKAAPHEVGGKGMAIAALVVAGIGLLLTIILYASLPALEGWVEEQCAANPDIQGCEEYQPNDGAAAHVPVAYAAWLPARPVWLPS